jgi:hypothetical protein
VGDPLVRFMQGVALWPADLHDLLALLGGQFRRITVHAAFDMSQPQREYESIEALLESAVGRQIEYLRLTAEDPRSSLSEGRLEIRLGSRMSEIEASPDSVVALGCVPLVKRVVERHSQWQVLAIIELAIASFLLTCITLAWWTLFRFNDRWDLGTSEGRWAYTTVVFFFGSLLLWWAYARHHRVQINSRDPGVPRRMVSNRVTKALVVVARQIDGRAVLNSLVAAAILAVLGAIVGLIRL